MDPRARFRSASVERLCLEIPPRFVSWLPLIGTLKRGRRERSDFRERHEVRGRKSEAKLSHSVNGARSYRVR